MSVFRRVAAIVFAAVALAHMARLVWAVPVTIGSVSIPLHWSWVALVAAGTLSLWGFGSRT